MESQSDIDVQAALAGWKDARALMVNAVKCYKAASTTLGTTCTHASNQYSNNELVENVLTELDSQSLGIASEEETLRDTRISLLQLRNQSKTLVSINAYPLEILIRILFFAKTYCYRLGREHEYNILAEVCTRWRKIVINQPKMWTHIDITPGHSLRMPNVFLERSRDLRLHVHIVDKSSTSAALPHVRQILKLLMPHMHRIHSLNLSTQGDRLRLDGLQLLLNAWCDHGPPTNNSLYFYRPRGGDIFYPDIFETREGSQIAQVSLNRVLLAVRNLHLEGVLFNQSNPVYHGLVDLRLHGPMFLNFDVPISLLANALTASPELAVLKMQNVNITSSENWIPPNPTKLGDLKVLNLVGLNASSMKLVLPLITQPNSHTRLSVGLTFWVHGAFDETRDFFSRSEVATVYRRDDISQFMIWGLFKPVSYLIIHEVEVIHPQSVLSQKAQEAGLNLGLPSIVPVQRLALLLCSFTLEGLVDLVRSCNVQYLRLEACTYLGEKSRDVDTHPAGMNTDDLPTIISHALPGIEYEICDFDSTIDWPCRALFEDEE